LSPSDLPTGLSHWSRDGSVVSSLHCMNDPQPEGHMASYIRRRKFLAMLLGGAAAAWSLAAGGSRQPRGPPSESWVRAYLRPRASGTPPVSSGCANSVGSMVAPSQSSIDGRRDATSAPPRSPPNSSCARLMSLSHRRLPESWLPNRRRRSSPLFSRRRGTLSAPAWSRHWRDRAATSPACRSSRPILLANGSNSCARSSPGLRRLAMLVNVGNRLAVLDLGEVQAAARTFGLEVITLEIRRGEDITPAFEALKGRAEALYVVIDPLVGTHRIRINTLVLAARLPTVHTLREGAQAGALL